MYIGSNEQSFTDKLLESGALRPGACKTSYCQQTLSLP